MADQALDKRDMTWTIGIYKTREAAEAGLKLWSDIYPEEAMNIDLDGAMFRLTVTVPDDPR
jgi:hypothetical protein